MTNIVARIVVAGSCLAGTAYLYGHGGAAPHSFEGAVMFALAITAGVVAALGWLPGRPRRS